MKPVPTGQANKPRRSSHQKKPPLASEQADIVVYENPDLNWKPIPMIVPAPNKKRVPAWHADTVDFYERVKRNPITAFYEDSDVMKAYIVARMWDKIFKAWDAGEKVPGLDLKEVREHEKQLVLTKEQRDMLGISFVRVEAQEEKKSEEVYGEYGNEEYDDDSNDDA